MSHQKISAQDLNINLASQEESEYFKWFLACLLFGKPIQQTVAKQAYISLIQAGLTSPTAILQAGWDRLVALLDEGHYVRFDYSTATKLLEVAQTLNKQYGGRITTLVQQSQSIDDLSTRLQAYKGVGPKTTEIFLRDITPYFSQMKTK